MRDKDDFVGALKSLSRDARKKFIMSQVMYPKASNLKNDTPVATLDKKEGFQAHYIKEYVKSNINLKAIDAQGDILAIVDALEECKDDLMLDFMDRIQFFKGGVTILSIEAATPPGQKDNGEKAGRSIYIEINSCQKELLFLLMANHNWLKWLVVAIIAFIFIPFLPKIKS